MDGTEEPSKDRPYGFLCRFGTREDPILAKITQNQYTEGYLLQLFTYKQDGKYAERQLALHTTFPAANHEAAVRAGQKLIRNTVKRYFKRVQAFSNTIPVNDEILYLGRK